ncbi:GNAT family N-acetyltransferase [Anaeromicropila populeti]|uniref:GNAT family N-acetyltransferase n=1 Tax=Anaeromicropila populeti TaxID=37658 RepID=UPI000B8A4E62|nr:GNAT family N-acetyltransferase [Anaeromicropila populeti]
MITCSNEEMIPQLKGIWKECFQDEDYYIDFFFWEKIQKPKAYHNMLVWVEDGEPAAMLTMMPAKLLVNNQLLSFWYIYGVATKRKWRNRSFATRLIEYANDMTYSVGGTFLVPATESLLRFYGRMGYEKMFYLDVIHMKIEECRKSDMGLVHFQPVTVQEYFKSRTNEFYQDGYVLWKKEEIRYAIKENELLGGICRQIRVNNQVYVIMAYKNRQCLYVKETTLPKELLEGTLQYLAEEMACKEIIVRVPVEECVLGRRKIFGLIRTNVGICKQKKGYLGLALD